MNESAIGEAYLASSLSRFESLKRTGEAAMAQMSDDDLQWAANDECNSVLIVVKHLRGNMISRWTDPLTTDGEKPDRNRDSEFVNDGAFSRKAMMAAWEEGWRCLLRTLQSFSVDDLTKILQIRGVDHTVVDAMNRQLLHVAYHVGQIVQIGKERLGAEWQTLSIPRGESEQYRPSTTNPWEPRS